MVGTQGFDHHGDVEQIAKARPLRLPRPIPQATFNSETCPLTQTAKPAELKPLDGSRGRLMGVIPAFNQLARRAEYFDERRCIVTNDGRSAAPFGTVGSESPNDKVSAGAHGAQDALDIGGAISRLSQEMKSRAIVPYVVGLGRFPSRHVGGDPPDACAAHAEPCLRRCKRFFGKVENGDRRKSFVQKSVDQPRRAAANIDD